MKPSDVLRAYKQLLILIKRLPRDEIQPALEEARRTVRLHKNETHPQKASDYYRLMVSKIGYLRMRTPRIQGDRECFKFSPGTYVLRDGDLVQDMAESKGKRVADGKVSMEEAHHIHNRLLRRQYFGKDPPKNPCGTF